MTKRETLLSPNMSAQRESGSRTPTEQKAFEKLIARVEAQYPHLKVGDKTRTRATAAAEIHPEAPQTRGRRAAPR
jgi:hypothetical protein